MSRPKARPAHTTAGPLAPAPDNGRPYVPHPDDDAPAVTRPARSRRVRGRQLSHRVPPELYDALTERGDALGMPVGVLVIRALRGEVRGLVIPEDLAQRVQDLAERLGTTPDRVLAGAVEAELARHGA